MNKEKIQEYCIYAIIAGKRAFVGKTTSDDYGAILRRHRRGENKHTRKHFGHRGSTEPKFVALLTVETDFTVAYRYVVAFIRSFLDDGYEVLNSCGMIDHAKNLHYHTQKILESIKLVPLLEEILWSELGTKQDYENEYGSKPLGEFVREIVGLEMNAAKEAFAEYLDETYLDSNQIYFVNQIVEYIVHNGLMKDLSVLQDAPFTDNGSIVEVFTDLTIWMGIRKVIERINANAVAA